MLSPLKSVVVSSVLITLAHLRKMRGLGSSSYCIAGSRAFAKRNGLDFGVFSRQGIDEKLLLETGDAMAIQLVEFAKQYERRQ